MTTYETFNSKFYINFAKHNERGGNEYLFKAYWFAQFDIFLGRQNPSNIT